MPGEGRRGLWAVGGGRGSEGLQMEGLGWACQWAGCSPSQASRAQGSYHDIVMPEQLQLGQVHCR